jgi:chromosomal replication initiator protein
MQKPDSVSTIWSEVLAVLESKLNQQIYNAWFRPIEFVKVEEDERVIHLKSNQVIKNWIGSYYSDAIQDALNSLGLGDCRIEWRVEEKDSRLTGGSAFESTPVVSVDAHNSKRNISTPSISTPLTAPAFTVHDPIENSLNRKYRFDTFIVGLSNEFAHAAALGAAESPGKTYNPLYIYGGVGLGKTHLMHAIGHAIKDRSPHMRVAYITSEKFMNDLINAIRYDKTQAFRERYRSIDVLLMDDVQFIAGKERTQEEFFHTFNALHNDQKQIVITSDCPPKEIPSLEERLHSRFEWGLIADIEPPDLETKVAILKRKADLDGVDLPDEIAFFIASKVKSNIRELEGSLVRLVAISSLRGVPISKMLAQDALKTIIDDRPKGLSIERIQNEVASRYKLTVEELKAKNNSRSVAVPRQIAMYLCKRLTNHSFPEIGKAFGNKHHTTVMHSVEKIGGLTKEDREFHRSVSEIIDVLCS